MQRCPSDVLQMSFRCLPAYNLFIQIFAELLARKDSVRFWLNSVNLDRQFVSMGNSEVSTVALAVLLHFRTSNTKWRRKVDVSRNRKDM